MLEFNIQSRIRGFLTFPDGATCAIFQPRAYPSRIIEGRDVCYIEVEGCEVSFSSEMHGVHVTFETGTIDATTGRAIVEDIAQRFVDLTGDDIVVYHS